MTPSPRSPSRWRRRVPAFAAAVLALVATGCEVAVDVGLDVATDGSGQVAVEVVLDPAASAQVDLGDQLRVEDLERAGWTVAGPQQRDDGATVVRASRPFATTDEAQAVLGQVSGAGGPMRAFEVGRRSSFLATTYSFEGVVDLRAGVEGFSDDELRAALAGSGFGLDDAALEQAIGAEVGDTFAFTVRAGLPGELAAQPPAQVTRDQARWNPAVGEQVELVATSRLVHTRRLAWLGVAATSGVALVVVSVLGRRRRRSQA